MSDQGQLHAPTFGKVPPELMHDMGITDGAVRLYAHMHWRYGSNHDNHEGQTSMAKYLGVSEVTIRSRIAELEAANWIVAIDRGFDKKSGNFSTCFYHVFVVQSECIEFRQEYVLKEGETLFEQPLPLERKLRKGKGGNSKNLPTHANSGYVGQPNSGYVGGANSSSDGHANSGYAYPDSSDPDSIHPDNTNTVAAKAAPVSKSLPPLTIVPKPEFVPKKKLKSIDRDGLLGYWQEHNSDLEALRIATGMKVDMVYAENMPDSVLREYVGLYIDVRRACIGVERYGLLVAKARKKFHWKDDMVLKCADISVTIPEFLMSYPPEIKQAPKSTEPDPLAGVIPAIPGVKVS